MFWAKEPVKNNKETTLKNSFIIGESFKKEKRKK
jgi:hypothetical protein